MWKGIFYAAIMFVSAVLQTLITAQYSHRMYLTGMRIRTALISAIYRKALLISNAAKKGGLFILLLLSAVPNSF